MQWLGGSVGSQLLGAGQGGQAIPANFFADITTKIDQNNRLLAKLIEAVQNMSPLATGTVTLDAAPTTTISNGAITATSLVLVNPVNAAAGDLIKGDGVYRTVVAGSFTIATASGSAAAGTETFQWGVFTPTILG